MKNLLKITVLLLLTFNFSLLTFGQTPNQFKYQAVLRDAGGQIMADEAVTVDISILQGSASGTSVFDETHNVTTTAQGLINLNIGSTEDLSVVDFSADTYFIEITVNGTVMGTSQLLSVPYALQTKTAENVTGEITESQISDLQDYYLATNPNGYISTYTVTESDVTNHEAALSITESQISDLGTYLENESDPAFTNNFDFTDASTGDLLQFNGTKWVKVTPTYISDYTVTESDVTTHQAALTITKSQISDFPANATTTTDGFMSSADKTKLNGLTNADGSETNVTAGTNVTVTGTGTSGDPYVVNATDQSPAHYVGELYGGGIVFYVYDDGQHGLIASLDDLSTGIQWGGYGTDITNCESGYDGAANTAAIVAQLGNVNTHAAGLCNLYTGGSQSDWYLPASWELNLLYNAAFMISYKLDNDGDGSTNGLTFSADYWSSTELNSNNAWYQYFGNGYQDTTNKNGTYRVRAVRRF